ncbi:MAG TPA: penicillin-binding protein activator [Noviherbaspirillum sp.]|uniref:penicillin-binding protein activator n=1 Tax=Noviherbaspirillum sp. TaxID=1926288 RepID=UPI002D5FB9BE|nr:penicillin-binding protein activator [Noviherbaspirillum sp.]HYD97492.1 penicillin-binding protein activator [Noviherbaspirillum sp.]
MSGLRATLAVLGIAFCGLCLPAQANTTATTVAQAETGAVDLSTTERTVSIALLLPLRSATLREPAEMVRAGFQAAYERENDGLAINIVETGDAPQDILSGYNAAVAMSDVVVGPLSRSGVAAVAQAGGVSKPTIALTPPEAAENGEVSVPPQMLLMGLSIEEEARQVASWAARDAKPGRALVLFTPTAWQRRAAKAFETEWQQKKREAEPLELAANDGFLNGRELLQLKKQIETDKPAVIFLALDARQARQVRAVMGKGVPLYGTSQLNPFALSDRAEGERALDMDGTRLLDIPWQLQPDHPAVMVYPRLVVAADQKRNADFERLYALGIDAYRVAREIAARRSNFEIDGVTGKLTVRFTQAQFSFARSAQPAVYREGSVIAVGQAR